MIHSYNSSFLSCRLGNQAVFSFYKLKVMNIKTQILNNLSCTSHLKENYKKLIENIDLNFFNVKIASQKSIVETPMLSITLKDGDAPALYLYFSNDEFYFKGYWKTFINLPLKKINECLMDEFYGTDDSGLINYYY